MSASENSLLTLAEFSHRLKWLSVWSGSVLFVFMPLRFLWWRLYSTWHGRETCATKCSGVRGRLCVWGCIVSAVNDCSILIAAGTSQSHVPRPLQIMRVNHLTPCMPKGLGSYLDAQPRLKPPLPQHLPRPRASGLRAGPVDHSRVMEPRLKGNVPDFIKGRLKARGGRFNRDLLPLWGCWTNYEPAAASSWNHDVILSVFAKCKYQIGKQLCARQQGSSWIQREENKSDGKCLSVLPFTSCKKWRHNEFHINLWMFQNQRIASVWKRENLQCSCFIWQYSIHSKNGSRIWGV